MHNIIYFLLNFHLTAWMHGHKFITFDSREVTLTLPSICIFANERTPIFKKGKEETKGITQRA